MNVRFSSTALAAAVLVTSLSLGACASNPPKPTDALATARTAITEAEAAGAMQAAPTELLAAREKLERAQAAMSKEDYATARQFAERAEADAVLAARKTNASKAELAAQELARSNEALRREADRKLTR